MAINCSVPCSTRTVNESNVHPLEQVRPLPAYTDNYIWTWQEDGAAYVVDPGDAEPVLAYLKESGLALAGILVTHHHPDHVHGISRLQETAPNIPIYGPADSPYTGITTALNDGDSVTLGRSTFEVIATPGHTLDHICYYHPQALFSGDTLFASGCGRLFEGSPEQMYRSLQRLAELPASTPVYCTHEYTLANLQFAAAARPEHAPTLQRLQEAQQQRAQNQVTLPSSIATEKTLNPFLCMHDPSLQGELNKQGFNTDDAVSTFASLRQWKDGFRA